MKTAIFYTVTFLAFLLPDSSMAMSKFILSVNCCSIDRVARFLNRKVLMLDQLCPARGPVEGFVRPSLGVLCSENIVHTDNLSLFHNLQFEILMQVV